MKLDLEPGDFQAVPPQVLRFTVDRLGGVGRRTNGPWACPCTPSEFSGAGASVKATRLLRFIDDCGG